jgi:hypothetical protein
MLNPLLTANRWDWQPHRKLGQCSWLCCVQVPRCCWWRSSHVNYAPAFFWRHCPECREASEHQPSEVWLSPTGSINLGFTTEGNLLLCSSYLPLGVSNWVPTTHHQALLGDNPCFISVIFFCWVLEVVTSVTTSPYPFYFVFVPRIPSNRKKVRFGKLLSRNRFLCFTIENRDKSQNSILIWNFLCACPRLLSNFR